LSRTSHGNAGATLNNANMEPHDKSLDTVDLELPGIGIPDSLSPKAFRPAYANAYSYNMQDFFITCILPVNLA